MSFIVDAVRFPVVLGFLLLLTSLPDPAYAGCQEQQLGDSFPGTLYGDALAIDGNTAVVGAWSYDVAGVPNAGAVFVHVFNGTNWEQQAQLVTETPTQDELLGVSVAIDGDVLAAGMYEFGGTPSPAAYVFTRSGTTWTQQQRITPWDAATFRNFGYRVALDGDYLAVGAPAFHVAAGAVYVYRWDGTAWVEDERLQLAEAAINDQFGISLSLRGNELVVAARISTDVYVFRRDAGGWTQTATLDASAVVESLVFDGTTIVGGSQDAFVDGNHFQGLATIWQRQGDGWSLPEQIVAEDGSPNDYFGWGVAVSGSVAVIGAPGAWRRDIDECGAVCPSDGAVYWFSRDATGWKQVAKTRPADYACGGFFGRQLAISSDSKLLVGRPSSGTVLVYDALPIPDCNGNGVPDACESDVDCNENGIPDECDIDSGFSVDCNGNGTPDECESDCNANGVPDDCDLTAGTSTDCDENNNPDECDPDCDADGIADACDPFAHCVPPAGCLLAGHGSFSQGYYYGSAVSIGNGYAFVGAADDGDCHTCVGGKAYAYRQEGADWVSDGQLTVPGQAFSFAERVAVHGTTGFIQDGTLTHVMRRDAGGWYYDTSLSGLVGPYAFDGTRLVGYSGTVAVVLAENGGAWGVVAQLIVSDPSASGGGVAIDGNTAVVGPFVFEHGGTTWVETAQLERFGPDDPCNTPPALGGSVSVSQDTIAMGDDQCCSSVSVPVYVYRKTNGTWAPEARLEYTSRYSRVDVEGDSLIVGNSGSVSIHRRSGTEWSPRARVRLPGGSGVSAREIAFDAGVLLAANLFMREAWFLGAGSDCNLNGIADECDIASGSSDGDADGDGVMDLCDVCEGWDDTIDTDGDGVPDDCDPCPLSDPDDSDGDGVCDSSDVCPGSDDTVDSDGDGLPDACDVCPNGDNAVDSDGDGVCDSSDACPGGDDAVDSDGDGVADDCDVCPDGGESCEPIAPLLLAGAPHNILKNRYISIDSRGADELLLGKRYQLRLTLTNTLVNGVTAVGAQWWGNIPDAECISIVGPTPPATPPTWDGCPTVHLTGCPIIPTSTYEIVAVSDGVASKLPLVAGTQAKPGAKWWGDCVGSFDGINWTAPNGATNIDDGVAAIKTFQDPNAFNATHVSVTDLAPALNGSQINKLVNINDVFSTILGFQGAEYPGPEIELCTDP